MAKKSDILVARVSAVLKYNGKRVVLHRGKTLVHANHPMVRGNEDVFTNLIVDYPVDEESETNKRLRAEAEEQKAKAEAVSEAVKEEPKSDAPKKRAPSVKKTTESAKKEDAVDG